MKRIVLLLLVSFLCLSLCSCQSMLQKAKSAITGEEISQMPEDYVTTLSNEQFEYELYKEYVKVISYLAEETEVTIPSEIDGKPVRVIGSLCFHQTADVTTVIIPDSVTEIEGSAFYYADALVSIVIPDSVERIGSRAFAWCNSLTSIDLGARITEIPEYCFNHCASLTSVTIPASVTKIGQRAFSFCDSLSDQIVPATVAEVGLRAFSGCPKLEFCTFENGDTSLASDVFTDSKAVVIIAPDSSRVKDYCTEYKMRWSTSKDISATLLGGSDESADASSDASK